MVRHIWFGSGLLLAGLFGFFGYGQIPGIIDALTPGVLRSDYVVLFRGDPFVAAAGYAALAAVFAFVTIFVPMAVWDGMIIRKIRAAIDRLSDAQRSGAAPGREDFIAAFSHSPELSASAGAFAATLQDQLNDGGDAGDSQFVLRSSVPSDDFFGPGAIVGGSLYLWFFRYLPHILLSFGALCLAVSIIVNLEFVFANAAPETRASQFLLLEAFRTGVVALTFAGLAAFVVATAMRIILALREAQATGLSARIAALYPGGAEARYLADVARESRQTGAEISTSIGKMGAKIHGDMVKHSQRVLDGTEAAAKAITESLAAAVHGAMSKPLTKLTSATRQLSRDQSDRARQLMEAVLANFVKELEGNFGSRTKEINSLLKSSSETMIKVEKTFGAALTELARQSKSQTADLTSEIKATLEAIQDNESGRFEQLNSDLANYCGALREQVEDHSDRFSSLLETLLKEATDIASSTLAQGASDIARTAERFDALYGAIENMVTLITPIMHQVMENQEALLSSLDSDASASKAIGRASSEMSAAAQASRETVERFIALAERMREVSSAMNATVAGRPLTRRPGPGPSSKKLSQAVRDLRTIAQETGLPELGKE